MIKSSTVLPADIASSVRRALSEDIGKGDLTANLVPENKTCHAEVICREEAVLCGSAWFDQVFHQVDETVMVDWMLADGDAIRPGSIVCRISGSSRSVLTGERTALNFLQTLSGTATRTREFARQLGNSKTRILDTRKTIPGLRAAQKYAVTCGGGSNHRTGLYDAILIKENHISSAGGIRPVVTEALRSGHAVEIEVENLAQLEEAIEAGANSVLLDNFSIEEMHQAVEINRGRVELEVSGGVEFEQLKQLANTGVDYISIGALTKHLRAVDFSMLFKHSDADS